MPSAAAACRCRPGDHLRPCADAPPPSMRSALREAMYELLGTAGNYEATAVTTKPQTNLTVFPKWPASPTTGRQLTRPRLLLQAPACSCLLLQAPACSQQTQMLATRTVAGRLVQVGQAAGRLTATHGAHFANDIRRNKRNSTCWQPSIAAQVEHGHRPVYSGWTNRYIRTRNYVVRCQSRTRLQSSVPCTSCVLLCLDLSRLVDVEHLAQIPDA